jgi:hypothetical protein
MIRKPYGYKCIYSSPRQSHIFVSLTNFWMNTPYRLSWNIWMAGDMDGPVHYNSMHSNSNTDVLSTVLYGSMCRVLHRWHIRLSECVVSRSTFHGRYACVLLATSNSKCLALGFISGVVPCLLCYSPLDRWLGTCRFPEQKLHLEILYPV